MVGASTESRLRKLIPSRDFSKASSVLYNSWVRCSYSTVACNSYTSTLLVVALKWLKKRGKKRKQNCITGCAKQHVYCNHSKEEGNRFFNLGFRPLAP